MSPLAPEQRRARRAERISYGAFLILLASFLTLLVSLYMAIWGYEVSRVGMTAVLTIIIMTGVCAVFDLYAKKQRSLPAPPEGSGP